MRALKTLPDNYRQAGSINLAKNFSALLWMNIAALTILVLSGWLFILVLYWMRPADAAAGLHIEESGFSGITEVLFKVLLIYIIMVVLHELVHGAFFWIFTHSMPVFALRSYYAYAAAPGWYLPRDQYLVTALAPLLLLDALALALLAVVPPGWFLILLVFTVSNTSGSVGDMYIAAWMLMHPPTCLAHDEGDKFSLFVAKDEQGEG
jgi:hypothetical protein